MKNFSSVIAFIFVLFIALGMNTRGTNGTRVCLVPLEYNVPCETSDCNSRCLYKFGVKAPGPGNIKGQIIGGNCIATSGKCYCSFCCEKDCS
ncbi:hypothetical protein KY285_010124 [Solanum tuberosum]|nr:hypothetical protein KY289_010695 [Solanum tuberosum]KAH0734417.1 hypothetical protein KY285_010124 [Solanum tuberosum]